MAKAVHKKVITFRPDRELSAAMDALKVRDGIPVSEQIRRAMREWLQTRGLRVARPTKSRRS